MKIKKVHFNWHQVNWDNSAGEDFHVFEIGQKGVVDITEHIPGGISASPYFEVLFDDGKVQRVYHPNQVFLES